MGVADDHARYTTVTAIARVFALIVLAPPVGFTGNYETVVNLTLVGAVWMAAVFFDGLMRSTQTIALVVEACLVAFLAALTLSQSPVLLPALVVPLFIAGLGRGFRGVLAVLGAEIVILLAATLPNADIVVDAELVFIVFTWLMVGLGFGLIAVLVHRMSARASDETSTSYRDARVLITRLLDLSGELVDGLDPVSIGEKILSHTKEEVPLVGGVVLVPSGSGFTPLSALEGQTMPAHQEALLHVVELSRRPAKAESDVAFPLLTDAGLVAVVVGRLAPGTDVSSTALEEELAQLVQRLRPEALQLDTALLFASVRHEATREERRRLAREMHDGVAQDLASLGYLIDDLEADAATAESAQRTRDLRAELTRIVSDLRRSVFSLRSEPGESLGASIAELAAHIESRSGLTVEVELDEGTSRLRPDVEAELLRIAQEAMNNCVRHANASRIDVVCTVRAPAAEIRVSDDGRGLQRGRDDSHGVRIMRERAKRVGASFRLDNSTNGPGTTLVVRLPADLTSRTTDPQGLVEQR